MKMTLYTDSFLKAGRTTSYVDDFFSYTSTDLWTTVKDATPAVVAGAGTTRQSEAQFTTGATDNDECYISGTIKHGRLAADRAIICEADINVAAVTSANYVFGVTSIGTANFIVDDGAGLATNFNGFAFFKKDGSTSWFVMISATTTQTIVELTAANSADKVAHIATASYQNFRMEFATPTTTKAEVSFFIDNVLVYKFTDWTFTAANVAPTLGIKAGDTANTATLNCDYVAFAQARI